MKTLACGVALMVLGGLCAAQETNFPVGPQYLMTFGSPMFARPIATPSMSLDSPLSSLGTASAAENQVAGPEYEETSRVLDEQQQMYRFHVYYGVPLPSVVEISFSRESEARELPPSIAEDGVTVLTTAEALQMRGYGLTLGEAARQQKGTRIAAPHVYTNGDIPPGGN